MSQHEANLSNLVEQMKQFVENKEDCKDKNLFTIPIMKMCLRSTDYEIDKAYALAFKYFERFEKHKINIESKDKLMQSLNSSIIKVSSSKGLKDETIILFDLFLWNPKEIDEELIPCTIAVVLDYLLRDELFQINGCFILFNLTKLKLRHLSQVRKKLIKKILNAFEWTVPIKINKLIVLGNDKLSQRIFLKFLKKSMSKNLRDQMMILKKAEFTKLNEFMNSMIIEGQSKEMKFLNLSILINEALDYLEGYVFDGKTSYCSLLPEYNEEADNEMLNKTLKDVDETKLDSGKLDSPEFESTSSN